MKIQKKKSKLPTIIATLLIVALLAGAIYIYVVQFSPSNNNTRDTEDSTLNEGKGKVENPQSPDSNNNSEDKTTSPNTDTAAPPTQDEVSGKNIVQMVSSVDSSNSTVYIRGGTNTPIPENGACFALLTGPSGRSVRKDTTTLQNPASTDCKTISIPKSELNKGEWSFTLNYTSENYQGVSGENRFSI